MTPERLRVLVLLISGAVAAVVCGLFSAAQYGTVTAGRKYEESKAGCSGDTGSYSSK